MLKPTPRVDEVHEKCARELTLGELFECEETPLLRYAFSLTGRRAVAEEIVQEVFLQLHARWNDVDSPKAWLFRSVRNRAFDHLRNLKREVLVRDGEETQPNAALDDETPEDLLLKMETLATLRVTLTDLDPKDQQLIRLKYFEGQRYSDISNQTGLSVSNVGYRLHQILKNLADQLRLRGVDGKQ